MALFNFRRDTVAAATPAADVEAFLQGYSIEVMPRTAEKVEDFKALLPSGTRVYIAHIEGTPISDMVATAKRLHADGFPVMPHFPARIIPDRATLADWIARYKGEADVKQALLLGGGVNNVIDTSKCSVQAGLVSDIADKESQAGVVERFLHLPLFHLVSRIDDYFRWVMLPEGHLDELLPERPGTPGD